MLDSYKAGGWTEELVPIIQDVQTLSQVIDELDLVENYATYILVSDVTRLALLKGTAEDINILALHQTKSPLWKKGVYSQASKTGNTNYRAISYKSQVGNFKKWFAEHGKQIPYLKQADAVDIMNPDHVFKDGKPRPYPMKLVAVYTPAKTNFILTTHELLRTYMEGEQVPTIKFKPTLAPEGSEQWFKLLAWSSPERTRKLVRELEVVGKYQQRYNESIIRLDKEITTIPANETEGLDRIQETTNSPLYPNTKVKLGYIIYSEIPVLIEKN